jgi:hypothetical protein
MSGEGMIQMWRPILRTFKKKPGHFVFSRYPFRDIGYRKSFVKCCLVGSQLSVGDRDKGINQRMIFIMVMINIFCKVFDIIP